MNYCLIGKDNFRVHERIEAVMAELRARFPQLQQVQLAPTVTLTELAGQLDAQSLWGEQRLVVVEGLLANKDQAIITFVQDWLQQNNLLTQLILVEETDPPKKLLQAWSKMPTLSVEHYSPLTAAETRHWLQQKLLNYQLHLDAPAIAWLLANFGNDLWRLSNEIVKLKWLFAQKNISLALVKTVIVPVLDDNIFATIDALAQRNLILANRLINTQLSAGTVELELMTMIAYQFRNIALAKVLSAQKIAPSDIAKRTELHPFVVKKSLQFTRNFSWEQLQKIVGLIQKVDQAIKRGQTPPKIGLDILMAQIIKA